MTSTIKNPTLSQFISTKQQFEDLSESRCMLGGLEAVRGCTYWDDRLWIEQAKDGRWYVDLYGGEFIGSLEDCEAELWAASINENVFDDRFSAEWKDNPVHSS